MPRPWDKEPRMLLVQRLWLQFVLIILCFALFAPHPPQGWRYVLDFACAAYIGWQLFEDDA